MKILFFEQDRKEFIKLLAEKIGVESKYLGAPNFSYQVGPYIVNRDGTMEVEDSEADIALLRELSVQGLIDNSWDEEREVIDVSLPVLEYDGISLTNLLKMIYNRSEIISKAVGSLGAFEIDEELLIRIAKEEPDTRERFLELWEEGNGNACCKGLEIDDEKIHFSGFPMTADPDTVKAYTDLASLICQMAKKQKRANFGKVDSPNEKYSFRVWLIRMGMNGDEYSESRRILLSRLSGNGAFRTKEQAEIAKEKLRAARSQTKGVE